MFFHPGLSCACLTIRPSHQAGLSLAREISGWQRTQAAYWSRFTELEAQMVLLACNIPPWPVPPWPERNIPHSSEPSHLRPAKLQIRLLCRFLTIIWCKRMSRTSYSACSSRTLPEALRWVANPLPLSLLPTLTLRSSLPPQRSAHWRPILRLTSPSLGWDFLNRP